MNHAFLSFLRRSKSFLKSIRIRLTLWSILVVACILIFAEYLIYNNEASLLRLNLTQSQNQQIQSISHIYSVESNTLVPRADNNISFSIVDKDNTILLLSLDGKIQQSWGAGLQDIDQHSIIQHIQQQANKIESSQSGWSFSTVDSNGYTIEAHSLEDLWLYQSSMSDTEPDAGTYAITSATISSNHKIKALIVLIQTTTMPQQLSSLTHEFLLLSPLILFLASIGGYWIADRAIRPIKIITSTTRMITHTDLHQRLDLQNQDELGALGQTIDSMLERLQQSFTRQRQFTADVSHELRTPLSIIDLEASRALMHAQTLGDYQRALSIIQQESKHMTELITGLLTLARADEKQLLLTGEELDISELVIDTVERLSEITDEQHLRICIQSLPELMVRGDRTNIMQVLTNVVHNALKYSAGIGTQLEISMEARHEQGQWWACIIIQDDGPGIPSEDLPHIFERFYRVKASHKHTAQTPDQLPETGNGLGLGLAIVQQIVEAHSGYIHVASKPGKGTRFDIYLPLLVTGEQKKKRREA